MHPDPFIKRGVRWQRRDDSVERAPGQMIDPFREDDPRWMPREDSVENALVPNFKDFVHEHERATPKHERPNLPNGTYLQQLSSGAWGLFVPCGSAGYRCVEGSREELLALAQTLTTET